MNIAAAWPGLCLLCLGPSSVIPQTPAKEPPPGELFLPKGPTECCDCNRREMGWRTGALQVAEGRVFRPIS